MSVFLDKPKKISNENKKNRNTNKEIMKYSRYNIKDLSFCI